MPHRSSVSVEVFFMLFVNGFVLMHIFVVFLQVVFYTSGCPWYFLRVLDMRVVNSNR